MYYMMWCIYNYLRIFITYPLLSCCLNAGMWRHPWTPADTSRDNKLGAERWLVEGPVACLRFCKILGTSMLQGKGTCQECSSQRWLYEALCQLAKELANETTWSLSLCGVVAFKCRGSCSRSNKVYVDFVWFSTWFFRGLAGLAGLAGNAVARW